MGNRIANYKYKHKKVSMADAIPLYTPFTIVIEPTNACNFKCAFCFHSLSNDELKRKGFKKNILELDDLKKIIDDIEKSKFKIKVLRFSGFGEPLLNKKLPDMIYYAKEKNIAERIMVISNGSHLNYELSLELIDTGLDEMLISVQGLSDHHYKKLCSVEFNFKELVNNIKFYHLNKNNSLIHTRILSNGMTEQECNLYYETFNDITDGAFIDNIFPLFKGVDYTGLVHDYNVDIEGKPIKDLNICVQPFNALFVHASGNVTVCSNDYLEKIDLGNIQQKSITDIWNGNKLYNFRVMHLRKLRKEHIICGDCDYMNYVNQEESILDGREEEILLRLNNSQSEKIWNSLHQDKKPWQ